LPTLVSTGVHLIESLFQKFALPNGPMFEPYTHVDVVNDVIDRQKSFLTRMSRNEICRIVTPGAQYDRLHMYGWAAVVAIDMSEEADSALDTIYNSYTYWSK